MEIHPSARKHAIADEDIERAVRNAMAIDDVDETLRRRGGRPPLGSAAASVESVRLELKLREALTKRADLDHETTSAVIRKALRHYLKVG